LFFSIIEKKHCISVTDPKSFMELPPKKPICFIYGLSLKVIAEGETMPFVLESGKEKLETK
jgi:hypothetical protein